MVLALLCTASAFLVSSAHAIPEPAQGATLYFKRSSIELTRTDQAILRGLVKELKADDRIDVVGLPSDRESGSALLSKDRADKVASFLVSQGVAREKIQVKALTLPKKRPLTSEAAEDLHAQKVEVVVYPAEL